MKKVFIDFETQSKNDIRLGTYHYMACPEFRAYLLSYSIDGKEIITLENPKILPKELKGNHLFISHNTNFDVPIFEKVFNTKIENYLDTSWLCRVLNIPASLAKACEFFGITGKDDEGKKILSKYYEPGEIPTNHLEILKAYNRQDIKALISLYDILSTLDEKYLIENYKIYESVQSQNSIKLDREKLKFLFNLKKGLLKKTEKEALKKFPTYKKTGEKNPVTIARSANEIKKFLKTKGIEINTISKNEIEEELDLAGIKLDKESEELINFYRILQSKGLSKYDTFMEYNSDIIRDFQVSHGTHTGRPAGRGLQLHNISRPPKDIENLSFEKIFGLLPKNDRENNGIRQAQILSSLIWSCLIPDEKNHVIGRYDLSAIEPRVGAFIRNDKKILELYRNSDKGLCKDQYDQFSEIMKFPKDIARQLSKIIILAADYGQGGKRMRTTCLNAGIEITEEKAKIYSAQHHALNPSVKRTWKELEIAFKNCFVNGKSTYNCFEFEKIKIGGFNFIAVKLPTGRYKFYSKVRLENNRILYNDLRFGTQELRGYLLYENLVQTLATDILFYRALQCKGVKLTIYDELIVSVPMKGIEKVKKIMSEEKPIAIPINFKGGESFTFWKGDKVK